MNIHTALNHFEWKLKNHWKPTEKDIEAYNSIIEWKELQESENLSRNESLAKLWIERFLLFAWVGGHDTKGCISEIDTILERSVYDWVKTLQKQIPMLKMALKCEMRDVDLYNVTEREKNIIQTANKNDELIKILNEKPSIDMLIKFVSSEITRDLNKYEKL